MVYRPPFASKIERLVAPYGLVAKAGVWYLVYASEDVIHVHQASDLLDARMSDESFERPAGFDLVAFWEGWCAEHEAVLTDFTATLRVAPTLIAEHPRHFGSAIHAKLAQAGPPDAEGWVTLELSFESFEAARDRILGFGRGVQVLEPRALQISVLDYAEQIVALYWRRPSRPASELLSLWQP